MKRVPDFLPVGWICVLIPEQGIGQKQKPVISREGHLPLQSPALGERLLHLEVIDVLVGVPADFFPRSGSYERLAIHGAGKLPIASNQGKITTSQL